MTSELLNYLKKHIENVIQNMYLSHLELAIVETVGESYEDLTIRLIDSGIIIPRQFLWIAEHLQNYSQKSKWEDQQSTTANGTENHSHYVPENINQIFEQQY